MFDRVTADEIKYERDLELAQEVLDASLDAMIAEVMDEIADGRHDRELVSSSLFDHADMGAIFRAVCLGQQPEILALTDGKAGLQAYAEEVARERLS
jgi:hypothetical protein